MFAVASQKVSNSQCLSILVKFHRNFNTDKNCECFRK